MGLAKKLFQTTVQWSKKHAFALALFTSLFSIGVSYVQTRGSSTADLFWKARCTSNVVCEIPFICLL